ncbi:MAG: putative signaling protein [Gammaproteobacteria bacterium]|nr:putative signaling protein [Gammaproteobacteria bacterium]
MTTSPENGEESSSLATKEELRKAAQWAGISDPEHLTLEAVEQRRFQLWIIAIIILISIGIAFAIALGPQEPSLPEWITPTMIQVSSLVLVILFGGYALEKELYLRRLTSLLLKQRVLAKSLLDCVEEFNILLEAGKSMNLELKLDDVLKKITHCARDLLGARGTKILLAMGEHEFRTVAEIGQSSDSDQFLAELVMVKREGALSKNPDRDQRASRDVMCVPMIHRDEFFGVITLTSRDGESFTDNDLRALSLFGEQAASAVANAKLYEEQRLYAFRSSFQASHDGLTRLPNRNLFLNNLRKLIHTRKDSGEPFAVLFVDMDRFKRINDGLGHAAGDAVLMECGLRIRHSVRDNDFAARFGGDEFIILAPQIRNRENAIELAKRIAESIGATMQVSSREVSLGCSIGVAIWEEGIDAEMIIGNADVAAQEAKKNIGKVVVYNRSMRSRALEEIKLEQSLKRALDENLLATYYQPIIHLDGSSDMAGVEALVRWCPPGEDPVPARAFIATAQRTGLLSEMDKWLLDKACSIAKQLPPAANGKSIPVHVNIHPSHLRAPHLIERFARAIEKHHLTPGQLVIEITEYAVVGDSSYVRRTLNALKRLGVQLALDDFGVGFSSLSYLTRLPIDIIKIDQSFIAGLGDSTQESLLIETIVKMADLLQLDVIAEGIETDYQLTTLRNLGCNCGQGNYLAQPMPDSQLISSPAVSVG